MYESLLNFPGSLFADFDRVRREMDNWLAQGDASQGIRSVAASSFPNLNIGRTSSSFDVFAFAPGIDASKTDVTLDRGVLTISGERPLPQDESESNVYGQERFHGKFRRAVSLPDDVDPDKVEARYTDGILHVRIGRREAMQPKRISIA